MKGLDTNVLVRYLVRDDPRQAEAAEQAVRTCVETGEKMLIQPLVLCELIWVLETAYGFRKTELAPVLEQILRTSQFDVAERDTVRRALADYRTGKGDFSDYFLAGANEDAGASETLTFDKALKSDPRFTLLK